VIIPNLNQGKFINEAISSVVMQKVKKNVLVLDGGSVDESVSVIRQFEKELLYWMSEKDNGQSHAINKGLQRAVGTVINWINSDDYLEEGALEKIQKAFENPEVNVYIGKSNIVENGKILRQSRGTDIYPGNLAKTVGRARIDQPETWWRKSIIDEIGPLNEALHYTMDRDWWIKYLLRYGLTGIKKEEVVLANFRLHAKSKTVNQSSAFNRERNTYYRSLAENYRLFDIAKFLQNEISAGLVHLTNMPKIVDLEMLRASFAYFFLLLADEAYVLGDHRKVKAILNEIDLDHLTIEDVALAEKLKSRARFPRTMIQMARKFRG